MKAPLGAVMLALVVAILLLVVNHYAVAEGSLLSLLTREIGLALLVAVAIWFIFEVSTQQESEEVWNKRIEAMASNVFFGVLKRNLPEKFIQEARALALENDFVRSNLTVTYTITDATYTDRAGHLRKFVRVSAVASSRIKNLGSVKGDLPVAIGLPNPLIDEMKCECRVTGVLIKRGTQEERPPLEDATAKFAEAIKDDTKHQIPFHVCTIPVEPGEEVELTMSYLMAKEAEDTEIFQTKYPASSITVTILDRGPTKRAVRARAIHLAELDNASSAEDDGTYVYKLERFFLPRQGFAVWWKEVPVPSAGTLLGGPSNSPDVA
jgi:hypothetical protein